MTPNRVQRGAKKKRRVPLALLIVPIVLVAIGVAILLALRGGAVPIIGGGDEPAPPFDFIVKPATAISTAPDADEAALSASADQVAQEITPVIDDLYTNAFLDPSNWRHDDYDEVFETFAPDAAATAEQSVETLTLGATAGDVFRDRRPGQEQAVVPGAVRPRRRAGDRRRDRDLPGHRGTQGRHVPRDRERGRVLPPPGRRPRAGWKITAFDVTRDDHETQPPPSPSASTSVSPSA